METWMTWLANAAPIAILVLLWVFFTRYPRMSWWGKYQEKQLELLEQQLVALRQTNELLKKLAEGR